VCPENDLVKAEGCCHGVLPGGVGGKGGGVTSGTEGLTPKVPPTLRDALEKGKLKKTHPENHQGQKTRGGGKGRFEGSGGEKVATGGTQSVEIWGGGGGGGVWESGQILEIMRPIP